MPRRHAPQQRRPWRPKGSIEEIRECAPLCLTRAFAGAGPMRLGADRPPTTILHHVAAGGKTAGFTQLSPGLSIPR